MREKGIDGACHTCSLRATITLTLTPFFQNCLSLRNVVRASARSDAMEDKRKEISKTWKALLRALQSESKGHPING